MNRIVRMNKISKSDAYSCCSLVDIQSILKILFILSKIVLGGERE